MHRPLGLGAYFANLVATYGPEIIGSYGRSMVVYYPLCILYVVIFFPIYAFLAGGKLGVRTMLKYIFPPAVTAFATQSSAATIPVNKEACDNIGVPKDVSDLVLPMGCTMHMDGSVLSSIVKIAFLYGIFGMDFAGVSTYAMAIVVAIPLRLRPLRRPRRRPWWAKCSLSTCSASPPRPSPSSPPWASSSTPPPPASMPPATPSPP